MLGGEPADREAVIRFLRGCYDETTGGFAAKPGAPPDPISTSVALMVLGELHLPQEPYLERGLTFMNDHTHGFEQVRMVAAGLEELHRTVPKARDWLKEIDAARNPDGSYGEGPGRARTTGLYVVAQQRLGGQPESKEAVLKVLRAGQRPDGGFGNDTPGGSDLESCYRIVRLFARLDAKPDDVPKLRAFIASCRNPDGGFGRRPDEPSSLHGTYYATILRHWLDGGK
jgi:prenyltransferase beta subunit